MAWTSDHERSDGEPANIICLVPAFSSEDDDITDTMLQRNQNAKNMNLGTQNSTESSCVAINQSDEVFLVKFKTMYQQIVDAVSSGIGVEPIIIQRAIKLSETKTRNDILRTVTALHQCPQRYDQHTDVVKLCGRRRHDHTPNEQCSNANRCG